ncbi:uncharacterized protein LOC17880208 isoform X2 [Capsella rubella]|uniref:uncharacterized protein LOC17880208 isoform X2 n=1 Tax=Capsella rubella TaxID=81985 RepID=UPI000CD50B94|nr:uncharacterized protein LOC17880208 isoform X2 [Capsella rubella]
MGDFFDEGKQQFVTVADGNAPPPVKYPSFKPPKSSFTDGGKHSAIDVFPLLVKEAAFPLKEDCSIDSSLLNCQKTQNRINVLLGGTDSYQSCVVDINVEKGNGGETVTSHDEVVGSVKSESVHMQKVLQRQASLSTDKTISERCHDAPTNRWRRYKRAASFDSRKIVILFSILSSVGTLILIYLTLRVKQNGDNNSFSHM